MVQGVEKRLVVNTNVDGTDSVEDVDHPTHAHDVVSIVTNAEQLCWDGRDEAHALIALFVKRCHCSPYLLVQANKGCLGYSYHFVPSKK